MKEKHMKKRFPLWAGLFLLCLAMSIGSCKDDKPSTDGYDPSKPVVFTDFSPNEGSIRTPLHIYGDNFGNDPSKVRITIGGKRTTAIGCKNDEIYCIVPSQAFEGTVQVSVTSTDGQSTVDYTFEKRLIYTPKISVSTLVGFEDKDGKSADVDGDFEKAQFQTPEWLLLDTFAIDKCLYVFGGAGAAIRKVDLIKKTVTTVLTKGQGGFGGMKFSTFDVTGDTIFVSDDHGQSHKERREVAYLLRTENFRKARPYVYDRTGYSCTYHPVEKALYYNTYWNATISKAVYNPLTSEMVGETMFPVYETESDHSFLHTHPKGDYMYITGARCIYKSIYNKQTKKYQTPNIFAGKFRNEYYEDAPGTNARFSEPLQGTFVRNEEYVKNGKEDIYDFYLCDRKSHCIRKITPEGIVSTYAGRGSATSDGNVHGHIDGDLRTEARFDQPSGIAYDEKAQMFYIADLENHQIRVISVE